MRMARIGDFRKVWQTACTAIGLSGRIVHESPGTSSTSGTIPDAQIPKAARKILSLVSARPTTVAIGA